MISYIVQSYLDNCGNSGANTCHKAPTLMGKSAFIRSKPIGSSRPVTLMTLDNFAPVCRSDSDHMRCRGAKSFVDDLVLSRGVVRSRAVHCCDLLRLSPLTRRFVRLRRT